MCRRRSSGSCRISFSVYRFRGPDGQLEREDDAPEDWPEEEIVLDVKGAAINDRETAYREVEYSHEPDIQLDEWESQQLAIEVWEACLDGDEE
jgi:hypothetical protein